MYKEDVQKPINIKYYQMGKKKAKNHQFARKILFNESCYEKAMDNIAKKWAKKLKTMNRKVHDKKN